MVQAANWIVVFSTPILLSRSSYGVFFLLGGAAGLTTIILLFYMPKTRGRSLEAIDGSFERPLLHSWPGRQGKSSSDQISEQEQEVLPRQPPSHAGVRRPRLQHTYTTARDQILVDSLPLRSRSYQATMV